jgi:hypothetical protein
VEAKDLMVDLTPSRLLEALDPATRPAVRKGLAKLARTAPVSIRAGTVCPHLHSIQNGLQLESLEVTAGARLKAMIEHGKLALLWLHTEHDEPYSKR